MLKELLEIKFRGKNMKPERLSIAELTDLAKALEKALKAIMLENDPTIEIPDNFISLVGISNRSAGPQFSIQPVIETQLRIAYLQFSEMSGQPNTDLMNKDTSNAFRIYSSFNKRHQSTMHIGLTKGKVFNQIAEFKEYKASRMNTFNDKTTLYGELLEIGGEKDNPKATILQYNGRKIEGHVTEDMVKKYRNLTYEFVRATGIATISGQTLMATSFVVEKIEAYKVLSMEDTYKTLRSALNQKNEQ